MSYTVWQVDAAQMTPYYNIALCEGLLSAGCNVTYIASDYLYTPLAYPPRLKRRFSYFKGLNHAGLLRYPRLRKLLRGVSYPLGNMELVNHATHEKPNIIHFQWSRLPRFDLPTIRELRHLGIPVVHTVHDVVPLFETSENPLLYNIYREVDALIVHSQNNKEQLLSQVSGLYADKVHVLPLVQLVSVPKINDQAHIMRQRHNIPEDAFVVLFLGNMKPYKGVDLLPEVIKLVNPQRENVYWLVVGKADDSTQQELLQQISLQDRTRVISHYVSNEDVAHYHHASDVAIFPYRHIFQSGALLTTMSFGLPVIATRVGSFPETIEGNGWLVPNEDVKALSQAVLESVNHPTLKEMGAQSLHLTNTRHHPKSVGQRLLHIYESLSKSSS